MKLLVAVALVCLALGAVEVESAPGIACSLIGCLNACPLGEILDERGCPSCQCCPPYACHMLPCEHERDERGCPYCKCKV